MASKTPATLKLVQRQPASRFSTATYELAGHPNVRVASHKWRRGERGHRETVNVWEAWTLQDLVDEQPRLASAFSRKSLVTKLSGLARRADAVCDGLRALHYGAAFAAWRDLAQAEADVLFDGDLGSIWTEGDDYDLREAARAAFERGQDPAAFVQEAFEEDLARMDGEEAEYLESLQYDDESEEE